MTETTSFARWLERELAARRINRSQLAAYMGRRAQTVSAWFNDGRLPSTEVCADLARVLHVPLEEVLRQAGHLPPAPEYPPPEPHIIPEALRPLREMSDEEQRAFALPALELAEALLQRARGGAGLAEQFPPPGGAARHGRQDDRPWPPGRGPVGRHRRYRDLPLHVLDHHSRGPRVLHSAPRPPGRTHLHLP